MPSLPTFTRKGKARSPTGEGGGLGLVNREDWIGSVARFWQRSYMPDYIGLSFLVVAYIVVRTPVQLADTLMVIGQSITDADRHGMNSWNSSPRRFIGCLI